jgi:hypothetical protein
MSTQHINTLKWTANSPDLNIIENLWAILKRRLKAWKVKPRNLDELWEAAEAEWYDIPDSTVHKLYESLLLRMFDTAMGNRWYTKY